MIIGNQYGATVMLFFKFKKNKVEPSRYVSEDICHGFFVSLFFGLHGGPFLPPQKLSSVNYGRDFTNKSSWQWYRRHALLHPLC
jgi:hypothetical protein